MNENLDLTKILDGCPEGAKFWSPVVGECYFDYINRELEEPIILSYKNNTRNYVLRLSSEGKYLSSYSSNIEDVDVCVFPSKDQRDWSKFERFWDKPKVEKFDPNNLQPFDKILARDCSDELWSIDFFSHKTGNIMRGLYSNWMYAIPFNEETKRLVNKRDDCPEYYKWWEE